MTLEFLRGYKSKKEEIRELTYKLDHIEDNDNLVGNDIIFDYRGGYPQPQAIVGTDRERYYKLSSRWSNRKSLLEEECQRVEEFVESIPDSLTRRIFRQSFIEGKTQEEVSRNLHISQSSISKKINNFSKWNNNKNTMRYNEN